MELCVSAATDTGKVRTQNQDIYVAERLLPWHDAWLLAVADGMGGHHGGQVASQIAVDTLQSVLHGHKDGQPSSQLLRDAFRVVNQRLLATAAHDPQLEGMGTTLTAAVWWRKQLFIAHVGDSRAYVINQHSCQQLTNDHSLVAEMVRKGDLNQEEARLHPQRHLLLRALGTPKEPEVDTYAYNMGEKDLLLLVTDGLTSLVREDEMMQVLSNSPLEEVPNQLIHLANYRGGYDNITVVVACRGLGRMSRS